MTIKSVTRELCPPVLWEGLKTLKRSLSIPAQASNSVPGSSEPSGQDLNIYWDPAMAQVLETWGMGNVWDEIQLLLVNCAGRVLDIACGTGKTMEIVSRFANLEVYGCDISDLLIGKALERGLPADHIMVADATRLNYGDNFFDYGYSIGSLEHFTEDGIMRFLAECHRVVSKTSFHQIPIAKGESNEGWIRHDQSFYNNTIEWWLEKYKSVYRNVHVLNSHWEGDISVGKWFVCKK